MRSVTVCCDQAECIIGNYWQCAVHPDQPTITASAKSSTETPLWYCWIFVDYGKEVMANHMAAGNYRYCKSLEYAKQMIQSEPNAIIWEIYSEPDKVNLSEYSTEENLLKFNNPPEIKKYAP